MKLTPKQASKMAGVSVNLIYGWVEAKLLTHYRMGMPGKRGAIRIDEKDLEAFLATLRKEGRQVLSVPSAPSSRTKPIKLEHLQLPLG